MGEQRDFKGVWIPKEIWLDSRLDALEKVVYTEIDSLSNYEAKCVKSNAALADFCQCSESKVSRAVSKLIELGYVEQISFDGRHRVLQSCLGYLPRQGKQIDEAESANKQASNTYSKPISNRVNKKESKTKNFNSIIGKYVTDEKTVSLVWEWIESRKQKGKLPSDKALEMNLKKLFDMAKQSGMTVNKYLEEVIARDWLAFYKINNFSYSSNQGNGNKKEKVPEAHIEIIRDRDF